MQINRISISDNEYPAGLRNIFIPPEELFVNGEILPRDDNAIAIVGTRRATRYGLEEAKKLSYDLALKGITIVSGMASGIDTAAHKGALAAGGRTIAVLGSGHDYIYPLENKKLYDEITRNGAVVTEHPGNTRPFPQNFPRRNRIISGLSKGVVVVEAPQKSGALITANFALEQGKEVFAMPGNINSTRSDGTNALIKEGAKLLASANDILEELKYVMPVSAEPAPDRNHDKELSLKNLSSDEKTIFGILDYKPKSRDEILETIDLPVQELSKALLGLELKKLIKALPGENFTKV
ncbi:MAG: DNA-protecting protein DprA [Candidatus Omnitrophica bacterium]|nr:DNA-protecting protein DprA [Candidatus Omnitrophota bacterium]